MASFEPLLFGKAIAGVILFGTFAVYGILTCVLSYHWKRFGFNAPAVLRMRRLHFTVSGILIAGAVLSFLPFF